LKYNQTVVSQFIYKHQQKGNCGLTSISDQYQELLLMNWQTINVISLWPTWMYN